MYKSSGTSLTTVSRSTVAHLRRGEERSTKTTGLACKKQLKHILRARIIILIRTRISKISLNTERRRGTGARKTNETPGREKKEEKEGKIPYARIVIRVGFSRACSRERRWKNDRRSIHFFIMTSTSASAMRLGSSSSLWSIVLPDSASAMRFGSSSSFWFIVSRRWTTPMAG